MKPEEIIRDAIEKTKANGIAIVRGPMFIWGHGPIPEACDFSGAVLFAHNKAKPNFPSGWLKTLCIDILGKDTWWWYRFNFGFSQGRCLQFLTIVDKKEVYLDDEVSKLGSRMAKKLGLIKKI